MDDFFSDLVSDGATGRNTLSPLRDMATIQYAIRTNMQVVTTLTREEVMAGSVLLPKQIVQILTDAIWDCDLPGVKDDLQTIEEGFTSKVVPLSERFDSLGYSALFLYPVAPENPCFRAVR